MKKRLLLQASLLAGLLAATCGVQVPAALACGPDDGPVRPKPQPVATTTVKITAPVKVSVSVFDGETLVATFNGSGSLTVRSGKVLTFQAKKGNKVILSTPVRVSGAEIEVSFVDEPQTKKS